MNGYKTKKNVLWPFSSSRRKKTKQTAKEEIKKSRIPLGKVLPWKRKKFLISILPRPWRNKKNKIKSFQENFTFLNQNVVQLVENRKTMEDQISKLVRSFDRSHQEMASLRAATTTQSQGPTRNVGGVLRWDKSKL